jgi:hypothetical protein
LRAAAAAAGGGGFSTIMNKVLTATATQVDTDTELGGALPTTFAHLLLVVTGRLTSGVFGGRNTPVYVRFNNDGGAVYSTGDIENSGAANAVGFEENATALGAEIGSIGGPVGKSGVCVALISDYAGTTFEKYLAFFSHARSGLATGTWSSRTGGGMWNSTNAITRIQVRSPDLANYVFAVGSRFTLYGLG